MSMSFKFGIVGHPDLLILRRSQIDGMASNLVMLRCGSDSFAERWTPSSLSAIISQR